MKHIIIIFLLFISAQVQPVAADGKYTEEEINAGKEIFRLKCVPCHGQAGEAMIGPAIGCHGVKNKSDKFIYDIIYFGRKGSHGIGMPSWGIGDPLTLPDDAEEFKKALETSKKYTALQVASFIKKVYGEPVRKKIGQDIVRQLGRIDHEEINMLIVYLRYMEKEQEKKPPPECLPNKTASYFKGDLGNGKKIFMEICAKCHGKNGTGDPFFMGEDLMPRDFTDKLYMSSNSDAYFNAVIKNGGLQLGRSAMMSAIAMNDKDIIDVITYIRTLSK